MSNISAPIARSTVKANLDDFSHAWRKRINGWKESAKGATEKSAAQQFWSDLFRCFGIIPERIDLFERDAVRASTGRSGWIDLFWSGVVLGEAKSLGRNLDVAHKQALDYLAGGSIGQHEWPKYVIVSDFENIRLTRLGDEGWVETFTIDEIGNYIDQLRFLAGYETVTKQEEEEASIEASRLMAKLFTAMAGDDVDEATGDEAPTDPEEEDGATQRSSMYLTRLLFLLYGDDAGLWEEDLFYRFVLNHTNADNLGSQLNSLFEVLNTPENHRRRVPDHFARFPYVNGSIFADSLPLEFFDHDMREVLLDACRFHWSRISPAVFGSMFQLVKSKEARRADGEHYTSEKNILKTIEPLFLDELRAEAEHLSGLADTPANLRRLKEFRDSLAEMIFCDPACGCGNFLVVAYRELRKIETGIIVEIRRREGQSGMALDVSWEQKLNIGQFYGFEINWWPAKIAETAMFLVDHQANRELADRIGTAPDRLPIEITAHIHHGNALHMGWSNFLPQVEGPTYLFGNPPFAGHKERTSTQTADLQKAWGTKKTGHLDFVTAWFAESIKLFRDRKGRFSFVATNSITQGESVFALFSPILESGWRIRFAYRPFEWNSEAPGKAAVHVVIIGFDREQQPKPKLVWADKSGLPPEHPEVISPYLFPGPPSVIVSPTRKLLSRELSPLRAGSTPIDWNHLVVTEEQYDEVRADPIASKYLRPYLGGDELINDLQRWCLWMADDDFDPRDVSKSAILRSRIEKVREKRSSRKRAATKKAAATPHLFGEIRQPSTDYLALPQSFADSRRYATAGHLTARDIASVKLFTVEDPDGFLFGLISSSMFITWQKTVGGRIKSDPSVSSSMVWNTFPVPDLSEKIRQNIIRGGERVLEARSMNPNRSLADHYNPLAMDPVLLKAHDALDRVVDKAMGAPRKLTTERQRQELLFESYARMTYKK